MLRSTIAAAVVLAASALFSPPSPVRASTPVVVSQVPAAIAELGLQPVGELPGTQVLNLAISLPLRNRDELDRLVADVSNPASAAYRQYLTPSEFTRRFGPSGQDYQALASFAREHGLSVTRTFPNRVVLDVRGTVADIESALHVRLKVYHHPTEDRTFFAPDTQPSLDLSVPVLGFSGLDNYEIPRPMVHPIDSSAGNVPLTGSGPGGLYLGYDFRRAYVPGVALDGTGQSVGLLEFDSGFYQSDITAYETAAGLPNVPVTPVLLDGYSGGPGNANIEVSLDIEMAIAMAPGLSEVRVYEGDVTVNLLNAMLADSTCKQFGASWTYPAGYLENQAWIQMAAQGQSYYNASGDSDAYTTSVRSPADNPYIMVVGGTTLTMTSGGAAYVSERVWNQNYSQGVGSSGGVSRYYTIPDWQQGTDMSGNQGSTTKRNTPDIGMIGDNVYITYGHGAHGGVAGTSVATPLYAAFTALVNQQADATSLPTIGFANAAYYLLGNSPDGACYYHDVTTGNNEWSQSPTKFLAVAGYDLCVGFGSPTPHLIDGLLGIYSCSSASVSPVVTNGASPAMVSPDPASGPCRVSFDLAASGPVKVTIVDVLGREVRTLANGTRSAGSYSVVWDTRDEGGRNVPGGVYLSRVETARGVRIGKFVIAR
jgi:subtilase family serine protease